METWGPDVTYSPGSELEYQCWDQECATYASNQRCVPPQNVTICKDTSSSPSRCVSGVSKVLSDSRHVTFKPVEEQGMKLETIHESPKRGRPGDTGLSSESGKTVGGYPTNMYCGSCSDSDEQEDKGIEPISVRSPPGSSPVIASDLSPKTTPGTSSAIIAVLQRLSMNLHPTRCDADPWCMYCTALQVLGSLVSAETSIRICMSGLDPKTPQAMRWDITRRTLSSLMTSTAGYLGRCSCVCAIGTPSS